MEDVGIYFGHLVYSRAIWSILWTFGLCILWPFGLCILWPFGLFNGHLVYLMAIWSILRPFGIFYGHLVYFSPLHQEKSGNPG
jgi:hypothetical protein